MAPKAEEELKMRIQELEKELNKQKSTLSTAESADATKWKRKYEQLKKQMAEEQAQRATRYKSQYSHSLKQSVNLL